MADPLHIETARFEKTTEALPAIAPQMPRVFVPIAPELRHRRNGQQRKSPGPEDPVDLREEVPIIHVFEHVEYRHGIHHTAANRKPCRIPLQKQSVG